MGNSTAGWGLSRRGMQRGAGGLVEEGFNGGLGIQYRCNSIGGLEG